MNELSTTAEQRCYPNAKGKKRQTRDVAYLSEVAFLSFTEDLLKMMGDKVSEAELARRVGVSRGYISRVFGGLENLTLETMTKLAVALGGSVRLHIAPQEADSAGDLFCESPIGEPR